MNADRSSLDLTPERYNPLDDPHGYPLDDDVDFAYDSLDDESYQASSASNSSDANASLPHSDTSSFPGSPLPAADFADDPALPNSDEYLDDLTYHPFPVRHTEPSSEYGFDVTGLEMEALEAQPEEQNPHLARSHRRASHSGSHPDVADRQNALPLPADPTDLSVADRIRLRSLTPATNVPNASNLDDVLVDVELYDNLRTGRSSLQAQPPAQQSGQAEVIDLTNEPDSPVQAHVPSISRHASQNPRRQNTQPRANPPSFARSDSSFLGGGAGGAAVRGPQVIDLTSDAPDPPRSRAAPASALPPRPQRRAFDSPDLLFVNQRQRTPQQEGRRSRLVRLPGFAELRRNLADGLEIFNLFNVGRNDGGDAGAGGAGLFARPFNPVGHVDLQYQHNAFARREPSPKPPYEPPPPAPAGFTRDTGGDTPFVCPACDEDLSYDPLETASATETNSARAGRSRKRPRSEHHFWALKSCGHVYCADCFEGRKAKRSDSGFRGDGKTPLCAVDDCETHVANKTAWVGIYL